LLCDLLQKYFEIDDNLEENKRQHLEKIDSLESIIRLFEVKMKNAQDQSNFLPIFIDIHVLKEA